MLCGSESRTASSDTYSSSGIAGDVRESSSGLTAAGSFFCSAFARRSTFFMSSAVYSDLGRMSRSASFRNPDEPAGLR